MCSYDSSCVVWVVWYAELTNKTKKINLIGSTLQNWFYTSWLCCRRSGGKIGTQTGTHSLFYFYTIVLVTITNTNTSLG